jgi:type I restriction-modification system DNA methylase subunit
VVSHFPRHCAPTGIVCTVLAHGSRSGQQTGEGTIRQVMGDTEVVGRIVALPPQLFYGLVVSVECRLAC